MVKPALKKARDIGLLGFAGGIILQGLKDEDKKER